MDEAILRNWNETVNDEDIVYHLGDVYFDKKQVHGLLYHLKGRKRLILGNHDDGRDQHLQAVFQKIMVWRMFPEVGALLTHVPVHPDTLNVNKCPINIHGHIHERNLPDGRYVNVSVEQIDYRPILLEEAVKRATRTGSIPTMRVGYAEFLAQDRAYQRGP